MKAVKVTYQLNRPRTEVDDTLDAKIIRGRRAVL